jgi:hypothetical protein
LNESIEDILKPKSKDEIIEYFKNLSTSKKIFIWNKYKLDGLKDFFPLILEIYTRFKEDFSEDRFGLSVFKWIHTAQSEIGGVGFGIFDYKTSRLQWVSLEQYDNEEYVHIFIGDDWKYENIIKDYSEFLKWFQDEYLNHFPVNEGIKDILKPKSREDIVKALEDIKFEQYVEFVDNEIDKQRVMYGNDIIFNKHREFVTYGWNHKTLPSEVAHNIIEKYYKEQWKPDGVMTLTNTGGMELKFIDKGEGVEYRYSGEIIPKGAEIEYECKIEINPETNIEEMNEVRAVFKDDRGEKWYLDEFMRIRT